MNQSRKSHQRKVFECYMAIKNDKSTRQFGRQTREDAMKMYKEEKAKEYGMTLEKFQNWLDEDDLTIISPINK